MPVSSFLFSSNFIPFDAIIYNGLIWSFDPILDHWMLGMGSMIAEYVRERIKMVNRIVFGVGVER